MPTLARADLESLLRARQLDRTLTTAMAPAAGAADDLASAATGHAALDARLGGGFPRGQLSELTGPASSGRTSVLLASLGAAAGRGELVALVDALDRLDVESAAAAGVDLSRLLWVRGHVVSHPGMCRDTNQRALEQAVKALTLVLQAGNFGLVVFDVADAPSDALRRLPFTTWLRLQRMVEGSQTACVLAGTSPVARSSAGVTINLGIRDWGLGIGGDKGIGRDWGLGIGGDKRIGHVGIRGGLMAGLRAEARVVHARTRLNDDRCVPVETLVTECARLPQLSALSSWPSALAPNPQSLIPNPQSLIPNP